MGVLQKYNEELFVKKFRSIPAAAGMPLIAFMKLVSCIAR